MNFAQCWMRDYFECVKKKCTLKTSRLNALAARFSSKIPEKSENVFVTEGCKPQDHPRISGVLWGLPTGSSQKEYSPSSLLLFFLLHFLGKPASLRQSPSTPSRAALQARWSLTPPPQHLTGCLPSGCLSIRPCLTSWHAAISQPISEPQEWGFPTIIPCVF